MYRHIIVVRQEVDRIDRHLHIDIRVPGHDLAVPEPPQQRAVYDPCFRPEIGHGEEVGLHEQGEVRALLFLRQGVVREAAVVVWMEDRLVPVFAIRIAVPTTHVRVVVFDSHALKVGIAVRWGG